MGTVLRPNRLVLNDTLVIALTGGRGSRLDPITRFIPKPIMPFGAKWAIIDLVIWSLYRSGFSKIAAVVQYHGGAVQEHLRRCMPMRPEGDCHIDFAPPDHILSPFFSGTADAVYQNLYRTEYYNYTFVVSGDHVFLMDGKQVYDFHRAKMADLTVMAHEVSVEDARGYGVVVVDEAGRIIDFQEKPKNPREIPGKPGRVYASMGIYFFSNDALTTYVGNQDFRARCIEMDSNDEYDFGRHVIPEMIRRGASVFAYPFAENTVPDQPAGTPYWEDVGTWKAYHRANLDLAGDSPSLNLYSKAWPIQSTADNRPPPKYANRSECEHVILASGCVVSGATVQSSLLGPRVHVHDGSWICETIVFGGVNIGNNVRITRAVIDEGVCIPDGTVIGEDPEEDRKKYHIDEDSGLVIVSRRTQF